MQQIKTYDHSGNAHSRFEAIRQRVATGIKWWAEHQAWPATDEIRIERHRSTCG
ncbi:hypothetical protein [Sphingomonas sp. SRS2]|uniref:hypothetical protein n=1 Tax=Sphingomonas sp. SRS2 TaxID=133190 RepID=UPI000AD702BD|nr:hypothetical protein [Sphingomonas sp. SRS2]